MWKKIDTERLGNSKVVNLLFKPAGIIMGSRLRERLMYPTKTLEIANVQPAQAVLEIGCGTGFFTIPAARIIGDDGWLIALDASSGFLEEVSRKVGDAELNNVVILKRDALNTKLDSEIVDKVLLFGVLPFPLLPLDKLLPEVHRLLKPDGTMSVWLFPPLVHSWVPRTIVKSGLFSIQDERSSVYNFRRLTHQS